MKYIPHDKAMTIVATTPRPDPDRAPALRDDVECLTVYEAAAREIFVKANGLQVYYRTYYKAAGKAGWGAGSRKDDLRQVVWRNG